MEVREGERPKDDDRRRDRDREATRDDDRRRDRSDGTDRKRERSRDDERRRDTREKDYRRRDSRRSSRSRERSRRRESRSRTPERRRPKRPSNFSDAPPDMAAMMMAAGGGAANVPVLPPGVTPEMMQMLQGVGLPPPLPAGSGGGGMMGMQLGGGLGGIDAAQQKIMRELFVGNTPEGTSETVLMDFLNAAIQQVNLIPTPGNPIVQCRVSDKFAFIELRTIEEANLCLSLTGIPFAGNMLKVGRPSKYTGPNIQASTWQQLTGSMAAVDGIDPETKLQRELFIGNTTPDMNEVELMNFLGAAMEQVGLTTQPGNPILTTRLSGKFAFVEVRSIEETNNALNMNGIPYLGAHLRVGRPTKYTGVQTPHMDWPELLARFMAGEKIGQSSQFNGGVGSGMGGMGGQGMGGALAPNVTTVLKLGNMVTAEDLVNDEDYNDIMEDTKEECSKFGYVVSVIIPRTNEPGMGQVFVEFSAPEQAQAAANVLSGRTFDGKQVLASFYDEKNYAEGNYGL